MWDLKTKTPAVESRGPRDQLDVRVGTLVLNGCRDRGRGLGRFFYLAALTPTRLGNRVALLRSWGGDCSLKGVEFCPLPPGTEGARSHFSVVTDSVAVTPWNQVTGREREEVGRGGEKKKGGALIHSFVHSFLPPLTSFSKYILPFRGWGHKREHDP